MPNFAKQIAGHGRFGDTLVAHLTKAQANTLQKAGGAGTINPTTGLLEFYKGTLENADGGQRTVADVFNNISQIQKDNVPEKADKNSFIGGSEASENQALAVADILNNTRYVYNDKEGIHQYMYFSEDGKDPYSDAAWKELDKKLGEVGSGIRKQVIGGNYGDTNEDMAPRDMSIFLRAIGPSGRSGNLKRGTPLVSKEQLFKAYEKLGVTPYDIDGKSDEGSFTGDGYTTFKRMDGNPISLAQEAVTGVARNMYENLGGTSLGPSGNPTAVDAGSFDSFSAFADAAFAPASYNQGSFANLAGMAGRVSREGIASWGWQMLQNYFNNPSTNAAGKGFRNKIDSKTHAGDTIGTDPTQDYSMYGDFGMDGGFGGGTYNQSFNRGFGIGT